MERAIISNDIIKGVKRVVTGGNVAVETCNEDVEGTHRAGIRNDIIDSVERYTTGSEVIESGGMPNISTEFAISNTSSSADSHTIANMTDDLSGFLPSARIMIVKQQSCSRKTFAARLNAELFDENIRKKLNIAGSSLQS